MDVEEVNRVLHALRWKYWVTGSDQRIHLNNYPEVRFPLSTGGRPDRGSEGWVRRKHRDGGMHEPATFAALIALSTRLPPDGDVLDIGALYGYFSLLAASVLPRARVHAFEANPGSFRELQRNVDANPQLIPSRIHSLNAAVSDGRSRRAPVGLRGFSVVEGDDSGVHLEVTSIDHYCAEHDLRPSVVKIDVEGYQAKVLPGAMDLIARHRPALLIEFDEQQKLARFGVSNKDLVVPFGALGYRLLWCSNHRTVEEFREIPIEAMGPEQEQNSLGVFITG